MSTLQAQHLAFHHVATTAASRRFQRSATNTVDTFVRVVMGTLAARATLRGERTESVFGLRVTAKVTAAGVVVWKIDGVQCGREACRQMILEAMEATSDFDHLFKARQQERLDRSERRAENQKLREILH